MTETSNSKPKLNSDEVEARLESIQTIESSDQRLSKLKELANIIGIGVDYADSGPGCKHKTISKTIKLINNWINNERTYALAVERDQREQRLEKLAKLSDERAEKAEKRAEEANRRSKWAFWISIIVAAAMVASVIISVYKEYKL
jgi:hypothetical protein